MRRLLSLAEKGDPGQPDLLGGVGVWQGDGKHTCVLFCCEVSVKVGQPGQSCDTRTAIRGVLKIRATIHSHRNTTLKTQGQAAYGS